MKNKDNSSKKVNFYNYLLNLVFSMTIPPADFKFCLVSLLKHSEGTVSQLISHLIMSFFGCYFCAFYEIKNKTKTQTKMSRHASLLKNVLNSL